MTRYRQIAHRLRINQGPGKPDIVSERPRHKNGRYLDLDEDGQSTTFVEIPDEIVHTVSTAAIQAMPQPPAASRGGKGVARGEGTG